MAGGTGGAGFAGAVAAARQCYEPVEQQGEQLQQCRQSAGLFADARLEWERTGRGNDGAKQFVVQVVAWRLEQQLLGWLLQTNAADSLKDIGMLFSVCVRLEVSTRSHATLLKPLLDALLTAAAVRAFCSDREPERREDQRAQLEDMTGTDVHYVVGALKRPGQGEAGDTVAWNSFLALPIELDEGLFNSRNGRTFLSVVEQVISQQQLELQAVYGSSENAEIIRADELEQTTVGLWEMTGQLVDVIQTNASFEDPRDPSSERDTPSSETPATVAHNVGELEDYLRMKADNSSAETQVIAVIPEPRATNNMDFSATEQLAAALSPQHDEPGIPTELLWKALDELAAVRSLEVLEVHASLLLGLQMRGGDSLSDQNVKAKSELERRIRRMVNRLTVGSQDHEQVPSLVALSAFCPGQVLEQVVLGARADTLHHSFYLEVLRSIPLLLKWEQDASDGVHTVFQCELRRAVLDVSSNQDLFESESDSLSAFLLALVGISAAMSPNRGNLMEIDELLGGVLVPVCSSLSSACSDDGDVAVATLLNVFTIVQLLLGKLVAAKTRYAGDTTPLRSLFALVARTYSSVGVAGAPHAIQLREKLLLILKNTMELSPEPATFITSEQAPLLVDVPLLTLVEPFAGHLMKEASLEKRRNLDAVRVYFDNKERKDGDHDLPVHAVRDAVSILLWRLLWNATYSTDLFSNVLPPDAELWGLVEAIAKEDFSMAMSGLPRVHGSALIENTVGEMMISCSETLFRVLYDRVILLLLKNESVAKKEDDAYVLVLPGWAQLLPDEESTAVKQLQCQLQPTHHAMKYVVKCWSLVTLSDKPPSKSALVESLRHVIVACDRAIASSQPSVPGSLFCIQWTCFLASVAYELQLDILPAWPNMHNQLELLLLRMLHELAHVKQVPEVNAHFSQLFVASWLAQLPVGRFSQVLNFLATKARP